MSGARSQRRCEMCIIKKDLEGMEIKCSGIEGEAECQECACFECERREE